jgi:hypothetical protein
VAGAYEAAQKTFDAASPDAARHIVCENPRRYVALGREFHQALAHAAVASLARSRPKARSVHASLSRPPPAG